MSDEVLVTKDGSVGLAQDLGEERWLWAQKERPVGALLYDLIRAR
jgi:hypothetical protein